MTLCRNGGTCGFPWSHPGEHIADHPLLACPTPHACALCVYRCMRRARGIPVKALFCLSDEEPRTQPDVQRSSHGCINCPTCHGQAYDPRRNSEIVGACLRLAELEVIFRR